MAAVRAAELTEAYRILSDEGRRNEYDRSLGANTAAPEHVPPAPATPAREPHQPATAEPPPAPVFNEPPPAASRQFKEERATIDLFVRKATISRFRQALAAIGPYDDAPMHGFDVACVPKAKSKLFARAKGPGLLGRFVAKVDAEAVAETWNDAGKWASSTDEVCVFLMGGSLAEPRELARAIFEQRRKTRANLTLIPVDVRNWDAHIPVDAPSVAKNLVERLKRGN